MNPGSFFYAKEHFGEGVTYFLVASLYLPVPFQLPLLVSRS